MINLLNNLGDDYPGYKDIKDVDDAIAIELVEEHGFDARSKTQWGERRYECDVNGLNLTWYYIRNGAALQFELTPIGGEPEKEFFFITTEDQIQYFDDNFIPWILWVLWGWDDPSE